MTIEFTLERVAVCSMFIAQLFFTFCLFLIQYILSSWFRKRYISDVVYSTSSFGISSHFMLNIDHMSWIMNTKCRMPAHKEEQQNVPLQNDMWDMWLDSSACTAILVYLDNIVNVRCECSVYMEYYLLFVRYEIQYSIQKHNKYSNNSINSYLKHENQARYQTARLLLLFSIRMNFWNFWWNGETFLFQSSHMTMITNK